MGTPSSNLGIDSRPFSTKDTSLRHLHEKAWSLRGPSWVTFRRAGHFPEAGPLGSLCLKSVGTLRSTMLGHRVGLATWQDIFLLVFRKAATLCQGTL